MLDDVTEFWERYLLDLPDEHPHRNASYTAWGFGDTASMADELGQLVLNGVKTATASLLWEYEHDEDSLPAVGEVSVVLDGRKYPLCIIETTGVNVLPFNEVDVQHAYDEGEGDRSLEYWREGHGRFFARVCERIGREPIDTMPVVCERFRVLFCV